MLDTEVKGRIDVLFKEFDKPETPGCALGVVVDGVLEYCRGYGCANLEYDIPVTGKTVFHIASMAKQFTAACIALLEEAGQISLDADIRTWFPQLPRYSWPVTVGNLIYMTNGLSDIYTLANYIVGVRENDFFTREQAWAMIKACDWLMFKPGEKWSYGNTGYFLLAELVERITGQNISEFAHNNIFAPLGMSNTFFRDDRTRIIKNRAESYSNYDHVHYNTREKPWTTRGHRLLINADIMELPGAGQVWSTVEDLFLWDRNFYHNKLGKGSPDLIKKLVTPGKLADGSPTPYAYGLFIREKAGFEYTSHGGWSNGWSCYMHRIPTRSCTVICLANHTDSFGALEVWDQSYSIPEQVMEMVLKDFKVPQHTQEEHRKVLADSAPSQWDILGRYQDKSDSWLLTVEVRDGKCIADLGYDRVLELIKVSAVLYRTTGGRETFTLTDNGLELVMQDGERERVFQRFIGSLSMERLKDYCGEYWCQALDTGFTVSAHNSGLLMMNTNRHNTAVDFHWLPSIDDTFLAEYPPYCPFYCITFLRNAAGAVAAMVFRDDEGSRRENLKFVKVS